MTLDEESTVLYAVTTEKGNSTFFRQVCRRKAQRYDAKKGGQGTVRRYIKV